MMSSEGGGCLEEEVSDWWAGRLSAGLLEQHQHRGRYGNDRDVTLVADFTLGRR